MIVDSLSQMVPETGNIPDTSKGGGKRLFGSAIASVQHQVANFHLAMPVAGSSVQIPAKVGRRSIFDRMGGRVPEIQGSDSPLPQRSSNRTVMIDRRMIGRSSSDGIRSVVADPSWEGAEIGGNDEFFSEAVGPLRRGRRTLARSSPYGPEAKWQHDLFDGVAASHPGSQIYVRNIPKACTESRLKTMFSKVGEVVAMKVDRGPLTTATISFLKPDAASLAIEAFHGSNMNGNTLKIAVLEVDGGWNNVARDPRGDTGSMGSRNGFVPSDKPRKSIFDRMT